MYKSTFFVALAGFVFFGGLAASLLGFGMTETLVSVSVWVALPIALVMLWLLSPDTRPCGILTFVICCALVQLELRYPGLGVGSGTVLLLQIVFSWREKYLHTPLGPGVMHLHDAATRFHTVPTEGRTPADLFAQQRLRRRRAF